MTHGTVLALALVAYWFTAQTIIDTGSGAGIFFAYGPFQTLDECLRVRSIILDAGTFTQVGHCTSTKPTVPRLLDRSA